MQTNTAKGVLIASFFGHELTGLCNSARLNVVDVTEAEWESMPSISKSWYVIEKTNMDDVVIWQSTSGEIFQTVPLSEPELICTSLAEYIQKS